MRPYEGNWCAHGRGVAGTRQAAMGLALHGGGRASSGRMERIGRPLLGTSEGIRHDGEGFHNVRGRDGALVAVRLGRR
jgi:hypothetical protein